MKLVHYLGATAAVLGVIAACTTTPTATKEDRICTPGAYVFCRCADTTKGTKLCQQDGQTFGPCATGTDGKCVGGEVKDPDTGRAVDDAGNPTGPKPPDPPDGPGELDSCPGKSISLPPGNDVKLANDTSRAVNDRKGKTGGACAAAAGAKDYVYRIIPSGSGSLSVTVEGKGALDPIVYLRSDCEKEDSQVDCAPQSGTKTTTLKTNVLNGTPYYLFIDGASGGSGEYNATLRLTTQPFCGDGRVTDGEACDDTNHTDGDGCNANCRGVDGNPASGGACPGQPVDVWPGQTVVGKGSNTTYGNTFGTPSTSACSATATAAELAETNTLSDHVYQVTPHATGNLSVTVTPTTPATGAAANFMISARTTCGILGTAATKCTNEFGSGNTTPEKLLVPVETGKAIFIAVDGGGITANKGDYTIEFKIQ